MIARSKLAAAIIATFGVFALPTAFADHAGHLFTAAKTRPVQESAVAKQAPAAATSPDSNVRVEPGMANGDYEYAGDEAGWVLMPAKYVFENGTLVHAKDCPFRVASAN